MSELIAELKELLIAELDLGERTPDSIGDEEFLFGDGLKLDSLDALQLAVAIEERYGVTISEGEEAQRAFAHVHALAEYIEARRNQSR